MNLERISRQDKKRIRPDFAQFGSISCPEADRLLAQTGNMHLRKLANCRDKEGQLWIPLFCDQLFLQHPGKLSRTIFAHKLLQH
jgi:hypothetical protein